MLSAFTRQFMAGATENWPPDKARTDNWSSTVINIRLVMQNILNNTVFLVAKEELEESKKFSR